MNRRSSGAAAVRRKSPKTIDEYIDRCAPRARPILRRIRATVAKAAPDATETISYRIPAFKLRRIVIYFAAFKNHIGFYPPAPKAFGKEIAQYKGPKGNLRFPMDKPIPMDLVKRLVRYRTDEILGKAKKKAGAARRASKKPT